VCYYLTTTGVAHPALGGRDLLGEQIEALQRAGIRAPIYTTVVWEENVARLRRDQAARRALVRMFPGAGARRGKLGGRPIAAEGTLDADAYDLIGHAYARCEEAEPFYEGSEFVRPRVGIFSASNPGIDGGKSAEGAVLLCEEVHYDCAVIDGLDSLDGLSVLILPDTTVVDKNLVARLRKFVGAGGKLIVSFRSGFDPVGEWALGNQNFKLLPFGGRLDALGKIGGIGREA